VKNAQPCVVVFKCKYEGGGVSLVIDDSTGAPMEVYVPPACRAYSMRTASKAIDAQLAVGSYVACMVGLYKLKSADPQLECAWFHSTLETIE
jgi:hypothetical protein